LRREELPAEQAVSSAGTPAQPVPDEEESVLDVAQKMEEGRRVTGIEAEEIVGSKVRIAQDIEKGEDVTGVRIGRIGSP
jgi:hypothetical protein